MSEWPYRSVYKAIHSLLRFSVCMHSSLYYVLPCKKKELHWLGKKDIVQYSVTAQ